MVYQRDHSNRHLSELTSLDLMQELVLNHHRAIYSLHI